MDAGDEVNKVAGRENKNGVRMGIIDCNVGCRGITECLVGQPIEVKLMGGRIPAVVVVVPWLVCP
jgi:hypothetical protein